MTNLHHIADEKLGGVEREYAEVDRTIEPRDYVTNGEDVGAVLYFAEGAHDFIHVRLDDSDDGRDVWYANAALALDPTGNVRIDGTVYRMVDRKADVGEKVLITDSQHPGFDGEVAYAHDDGSVSVNVGGIAEYYPYAEEYVVLEPIDQATADDLTLTEADVRNNPRQVIDLIANLAGRLSKAESTIESITRDLGWHEMGPGRIANLRNKVGELDYDIQRIDRKIDDEVKTANDYSEEIEEQIESLDDRIDRLGTANQQAYDILARNVETWAQEIETIKARMGDAGRALTAEERREL